MTLVLGVTGGVGTGKSTAMGMLGRLGAVTVSADEIAREVVVPGTPAYREIVERFGTKVLSPAGEIDRSVLGQIVFADPDARNVLNDITHPRIIEAMRSRIESFRATPPSPDAILAAEIPLLFECGLEGMVDQVLLIAVEQELQLGRLTTRGGLSREDALLRIGSQMPIAEKLPRADRVIWNNGSVEQLEQEVKLLWIELVSSRTV